MDRLRGSKHSEAGRKSDMVCTEDGIAHAKLRRWSGEQWGIKQRWPWSTYVQFVAHRSHSAEKSYECGPKKSISLFKTL